MHSHRLFSRDTFFYGWPAVIVFTLGMMLTLFLAHRLEQSEAKLAQARFAQVAHHHMQLVEEMLYGQLRELGALARYIELEAHLDRSRFQQMAATTNRFDVAAGWVQNVPRSQLDNYLAAMHATYGPSFRLHHPPDSVNIPLATEVRLYPVTYLTANLPNGFELGADVRLLPERRQAFNRALATRQTALLPLTSDLGTVEGAGLLLIEPVFRAGTGEGVTERHFGNLRGFVYLHVDLGGLIKAAMTSPLAIDDLPTREIPDIQLQLLDIGIEQTPLELYRNDSAVPPSPGPIRYSREIPVADHLFRLTAFPENPQSWMTGSNRQVALVSGTLMSVFAALSVFMVLQQRQRAERRVEHRTRELQVANAYRSGLLASAVDVAVIATDAEGLITLFSTGAENMLGYRAEQLVGQARPQILHQAEDFSLWQQKLSDQLGHPVPANEVYAAAIEARHHKSQHWVYQHRNGEPRQVQLTLSTIRSETDDVLGYLSIGIDLTDYVRAIEALEHSDQLLKDLSAEVPGMLYQFLMRPNGSSCYTFVSDGVEKVFEVTPVEARNSVKALYDRVHPDDKSSLFKDLDVARVELTPWVSEFRVQLPSKGIRWLRGEAHHRTLADGTLVSNGYISDITNIKQLELRLREQATIDPLTKTFNRRHLNAQWPQAVARYRRTGLPVSLIMLDIDHFKAINDTYGHSTGDDVLVRLSWLLNQAIRSTDLLYRFGGEEFLIVCEDTDLDGAKTLARALQEQLRTSQMPHQEHVTASFGVTEVVPGETMETALKRLDDLLYRAKRNGRDQIASSHPPDGTATWPRLPTSTSTRPTNGD
ncbi:PAS domain S-box-containing protein/diguanylate cyclase (GGDEF) domain-containing protein [Marinobacter zhejiangensis]|uniref:diguanylate cyclase n=2 Tax=Marinobacter zhejiangensis TaxID=488535 RepID=A0A1I4LZC9_9GAMM|nr:PAS domain S-box-containing protein/diguanylate cyclase (GGDEF) domain-containing protein [Marinobacter zhejiangensis]